MRWGRKALGAATWLALAGCDKVPLEDTSGTIDFTAAHWFANEKVAYVFFSLSEAPQRLIDPQWRLSWTATGPDGGPVTTAEAPIDFSQGVHLHAPTPCGDQRICASYSFPSDGAVTDMNLRFLYDKDSPLALTADIPVTVHGDDTTSDAFSALPYGVFDQTNQSLQVLIHHNFGEPPDELVPSFGLTRAFRAAGAVLTDATTAQITEATTKAGTPLLFPNSFCAPASPNAGTAAPFSVTGVAGWSPQTFAKEIGKNGVCFQVTPLDQSGKDLAKAQPAFGRRNPQLADGPPLTIVTPLKAAIQLPLVIRICPDDPAAGSMVDTKFFNYQEYILGIVDRPTDLCFYIGKETQFAASLKTLLSTRLTAAKAASTTNADFAFVVLLHERFTAEFTLIQSSLAEALYQLATAEQSQVSPRLTGALVYDSSTLYLPTAQQAHLIQWCPQDLAAQILSPTAPLADQNCTILPAAKLDLTVINFVAPLGPLPSLDQYTKYVASYGDAGVAKSPQLIINSVPTGVNTLIENTDFVTYFDSERYVIGAGEGARICGDRADDELANFRIRGATESDSVAGTDVTDINALWLSETAAGSYKIGIVWEYPFWGGIKYRGAVNGDIVSVVPYTKSFDAYQVLGDAKWSAQSFDFGHYVQHCYQYCDNPFFDSAGTYQIDTSWRTYAESACQAPVYPVPPKGAT